MSKLTFDRIAVVLFWVLGHVSLYFYLGLLLPYVTINSFIFVAWVVVSYLAHHKWSLFMVNKAYNLFES